MLIIKKLIIICTLCTAITSCVDYTTRQKDLQTKYPQGKVLPISSLLQENGYDFMIEDTITKTIYAVKYYQGSSTKISNMRLVK